MKAYFRLRHFQIYHNIKRIWNRYCYIIFFLLGISLGILGVFIIVKSSGDVTSLHETNRLQLNIFDSAYQNAMLNGKFNHLKLWRNSLTVRIRDAVILMILGFARYFKVWVSLFFILEGILTGFLIGASFISMGKWGILLVAAAFFPHFIIYIAAVFIMIKFFNKKEYHFKNTAAVITIIIILIIVGTFVESFINPYIQRWILYQIRNFI